MGKAHGSEFTLCFFGRPENLIDKRFLMPTHKKDSIQLRFLVEVSEIVPFFKGFNLIYKTYSTMLNLFDDYYPNIEHIKFNMQLWRVVLLLL